MNEYQVYVYLEQYIQVEADSEEHAKETALSQAGEIQAEIACIRNGRLWEPYEREQSENDPR